MATVTCPKCGAKLNINEADREFVFCEYCGEKIEVAPFVRHAAKTEKKYKQREEIEESEYSFAHGIGKLAGKLCHFFLKKPKKALLYTAICIALLGIMSVNSAKKQEQLAHQAELANLERERIGYSHLAEGEVQMPDIDTNTDYRIVKQDFEEAGFTNVTTEAVPDLTNTTTARYNRVIEVTVDGVPKLNVGSWYSIDVPIVISYHTVGDKTLTPSEEAWSIAHGLLFGSED